MSNSDVAGFIKNIRSLLSYHREAGISSYPRNENISTFCGIELERPLSGVCSEEKASVVEIPGRIVVDRAGRDRASVQISLSELAGEIGRCTACELSRDRIFPVAGRGTGTGRLMIIGDWLAATHGHSPEPDLVFGVEQDRMLSRMFSAIHIVPEDVFVTNVIKCAIPGTCHPLASHVRSCLPYLQQQITAVQPDMICVMGGVAAKAILGRGRSLSQLRGKLHEYKTQGGFSVPVLVTYHPTFLLENQEMKKATWEDLQLLAKKMSLISS
jgi:DNA polymerase